MILSTKNTTEHLLKKTGGQIYYGPFSGLNIPDKLISELSVSEILGLYESCLFPVWEALLSKQVNNIMMIGGGHGYYSATLSYLFQPNETYIFEANMAYHEMIIEWCKYNKINTPNLFPLATQEILATWEKPVELLICDCEGGESYLLNPLVYTWQLNCDIVVEVHPFIVDNLVSDIIKKFKKSHRIKIIYDDFNEDDKIAKILNGFSLQKLQYDKHPNHRWILKDGAKVFTSGLFLFLEKI
ncbi:hypothetical protein [Pedobacter paludis]|uniref:FkbM family methyltransferase n=1 Tax=Pedobacter paludis TaxID=2203212 RepID=A0A317F1B9_9SPHI|nr:hypothetical protein [Pedobacter paludis]PWS31679.1 hypothetical protein DF947_13925 [Pedobacter paludis]